MRRWRTRPSLPGEHGPVDGRWARVACTLFHAHLSVAMSVPGTLESQWWSTWRVEYEYRAPEVAVCLRMLRLAVLLGLFAVASAASVARAGVTSARPSTSLHTRRLSRDGPQLSAVTGPLSGQLPADFSLPKGRSVILFDGVCNFCNAWVGFVLDNDPEGLFCFASLQVRMRAPRPPGHRLRTAATPTETGRPRPLRPKPERAYEPCAAARSPSDVASSSRCAAARTTTSPRLSSSTPRASTRRYAVPRSLRPAPPTHSFATKAACRTDLLPRPRSGSRRANRKHTRAHGLTVARPAHGRPAHGRRRPPAVDGRASRGEGAAEAGAQRDGLGPHASAALCARPRLPGGGEQPLFDPRQGGGRGAALVHAAARRRDRGGPLFGVKRKFQRFCVCVCV